MLRTGYYTVKIGVKRIKMTSIRFTYKEEAEFWAEFLNEQATRKRDRTNVVMYLGFPETVNKGDDE